MDQQPNTTATLGTSALKAAVSRYHNELDGIASQGKLRTDWYQEVTQISMVLLVIS